MKKNIKHIFILASALVFLLPIILTVACSFMTSGELSSMFMLRKIPLSVIPHKFSLDGYYELLFTSDMYLGMFWNSVFIAFSIAIGNVIISVVVGYLLAKIKFPGRNILLFTYIAAMMMPFQVTILPNYIMVRAMNLYNTNWALILPGMLAPFGVFLMTQFIRTMPTEMMEAAALETKSALQLLLRVVAPMVCTGMLALFLLSFAESWNMVEQPLILLKDEWRHPLSLALVTIEKDQLSMAFAGSVLYLLPMIFLFRIFEEELVNGLSIVKF